VWWALSAHRYRPVRPRPRGAPAHPPTASRHRRLRARRPPPHPNTHRPVRHEPSQRRIAAQSCR
jgi:hypothetical protein